MDQDIENTTAYLEGVYDAYRGYCHEGGKGCDYDRGYAATMEWESVKEGITKGQ